ncbi:MAG: hypothetical protein IPK17_38365 [Chloroflexi bacterium]|uniref:hypothetical protein n=1 Tax=Candidatus Flexifilum breve TaxID=3140694 RepID=UPI0031349F68|nr:hypothetical protein [Chloroflexota bacterium]
MSCCLMRAPLGALYTIDARFLEAHEAGDAALISRHATLAEAGAASLRLQLEQSQRVREDAAALGGKHLLASIVAVTITRDEDERHYQFHLRTPSGGLLLQNFPLNETRVLKPMLQEQMNLSVPGSTVLATPLPVTLRLVDEAVRCDMPVARWSVIGVRQALCLPMNQIRQGDVLVLDGQHWLIRALVPDEVIVTRFTGAWGRPRPDESTTSFTLAAQTPYVIERRLDQVPAPTQMPAS